MFILLTTAIEVENRIKGLDSGADAYVTKPFHTDELISRIKSSLRVKCLNNELKEEKTKIAKLYEELEEDFNGIVQLLSNLIGHRVPNASVRGERAARMCKWVGERLGLESDVIKTLEVSARIHEIGKISFADDLIRKHPEELSSDEKHAAAHFPVLGQLILHRIPRMNSVSTILRHQLENYDGTGYPDNLFKDQIPISSRILRAINLIEQESTLQSKSIKDITETVEKGKGTLLDPHVVQLVTEYLEVVENPAWLEGKKQVSIYDLKVGMVIAHDLTTGNGTKLLSDKSKITLSILEKLLAHHQYDPIVNNVYVYDDKG